MSEKLTRRNFLKASALTALGAALAACAQPAPTVAPTKPASRIVAMSFCEPRSCRLQLSS